MKPETEVSFNKLKWIVYPEGEFCDTGNCGTTPVTYETERGTMRYTFLKIKEKNQSETFNQIISTFKFLKDNSSVTPKENRFTCPPNGWVDCMPGPDKDMSMCTQEAQTWYEANCPDYQGVAY